MAVRVYTIGHSTCSIEALIDLLRAHDVRQLIDVRTIPRSRRHPQYERDALSASLASAGIAYAHMSTLGGLRTPRRDSINTAWAHDGFRGYADHMQTAEFRAGLDALIEQARRVTTAIMCAEASPAHCHRSLLSDALLAEGADVRHILAADRAEPHAMTAFARVEGGRVTYPSSQPELPLTDA